MSPRTPGGRRRRRVVRGSGGGGRGARPGRTGAPPPRRGAGLRGAPECGPLRGAEGNRRPRSSAGRQGARARIPQAPVPGSACSRTRYPCDPARAARGAIGSDHDVEGEIATGGGGLAAAGGVGALPGDAAVSASRGISECVGLRGKCGISERERARNVRTESRDARSGNYQGGEPSLPCEANRWPPVRGATCSRGHLFAGPPAHGPLWSRGPGGAGPGGAGCAWTSELRRQRRRQGYPPRREPTQRELLSRPRSHTWPTGDLSARERLPELAPARCAPAWTPLRRTASAADPARSCAGAARAGLAGVSASRLLGVPAPRRGGGATYLAGFQRYLRPASPRGPNGGGAGARGRGGAGARGRGGAGSGARGAGRGAQARISSAPPGQLDARIPVPAGRQSARGFGGLGPGRT